MSWFQMCYLKFSALTEHLSSCNFTVNQNLCVHTSADKTKYCYNPKEGDPVGHSVILLTHVIKDMLTLNS